MGEPNIPADEMLKRRIAAWRKDSEDIMERRAIGDVTFGGSCTSSVDMTDLNIRSTSSQYVPKIKISPLLTHVLPEETLTLDLINKESRKMDNMSSIESQQRLQKSVKCQQTLKILHSQLNLGEEKQYALAQAVADICSNKGSIVPRPPLIPAVPVHHRPISPPAPTQKVVDTHRGGEDQASETTKGATGGAVCHQENPPKTLQDFQRLTIKQKLQLKVPEPTGQPSQAVPANQAATSFMRKSENTARNKYLAQL